MIANLLIKLALSDLKSSRILYKNREYRTSYFFFQQASEKANKSFGLIQEIITEDDLFDFKHNQAKIHRKGLTEQDAKVEQFLNAIRQFPGIENHDFLKQVNTAEYQKYLKGGLSFIDSLYSLDLINVPASELTFLLRQLRKLATGTDKLNNEKIEISAKEDRAFKRYMLGFADLIGMTGTDDALKDKNEMETVVNDQDQWQSYRNIVMTKILPLIADQMFIGTTLWFCAIVTVQHSSLARYPDRKGNNPIEIYKKKLPIVNKQPQFMDFLEVALKKLEHLIKLVSASGPKE